MKRQHMESTQSPLIYEVCGKTHKVDPSDYSNRPAEWAEVVRAVDFHNNLSKIVEDDIRHGRGLVEVEFEMKKGPHGEHPISSTFISDAVLSFCRSHVEEEHYFLMFFQRVKDEVDSSIPDDWMYEEYSFIPGEQKLNRSWFNRLSIVLNVIDEAHESDGGYLVENLMRYVEENEPEKLPRCDEDDITPQDLMSEYLSIYMEHFRKGLFEAKRYYTLRITSLEHHVVQLENYLLRNEGPREQKLNVEDILALTKKRKRLLKELSECRLLRGLLHLSESRFLEEI